MASKKKVVLKLVPKTRPVDMCVTCKTAQTAGIAKPLECACKGLFCQHTLHDHQQTCRQYKAKHRRLRINAIVRALEKSMTPADTDALSIVTRLNLLSEAVTMLLEGVK